MSDLNNLEPHLQHFYMRFLRKFRDAVTARRLAPAAAFDAAWAEAVAEAALTEEEAARMRAIVNADEKE